MSEKLVKDYSGFMKVNFKKELSALENTADDMLTRFDEFENLLGMVRTDRVVCLDEILPRSLSHRSQLNELFTRIDKMEELVMRVEEDLDRVEQAVEQGESDLTVANTSKFKSFLQPLFFKSPPDSSSTKTSRQKPLHNATSIFNTDDYFPNHHAVAKMED